MAGFLVIGVIASTDGQVAGGSALFVLVAVGALAVFRVRKRLTSQGSDLNQRS
jgi:MYXO-CTERM domain-containing protein